MSLQQIRAEKVDRRADVYAAGIVLWEMLTGPRLFNANNPGAIIYAAMNGAQQSPQQVNPAIPTPIDEACMRALTLQVDDRYQTTLEFAQALERAAQESSVAIASAWDLGAFIKELGAHRPPPTIESLASSDLVTASVAVPAQVQEPATLVRPSSPSGAAAQTGDSQITSVTSSHSVSSAKPAQWKLARICITVQSVTYQDNSRTLHNEALSCVVSRFFGRLSQRAPHRLSPPLISPMSPPRAARQRKPDRR